MAQYDALTVLYTFLTARDFLIMPIGLGAPFNPRGTPGGRRLDGFRSAEGPLFVFIKYTRRSQFSYSAHI